MDTFFVHLVFISNLLLSQSSPAVTLQATEHPFPELLQHLADPPTFTPVPSGNPFSSCEIFIKSKEDMFPPPTHSGVNPAVFPISLRKRTKTLTTVYKALGGPSLHIQP